MIFKILEGASAVVQEVKDPAFEWGNGSIALSMAGWLVAVAAGVVLILGGIYYLTHRQ